MLNLNEGEPLTYAFIKSMIAEIRSLESRVSNIDQEAQFIEVRGSTNNNAGSTKFADQNILIYCGSESYDKDTTRASFEKEILFKDASFSSAPIVIANISNPTKKGAEKAIVTITNVGTDKFKVNIDILSGAANPNNKIIQVDYIAIGPRKKTTTNT